jgi:hypothetical protein
VQLGLMREEDEAPKAKPEPKAVETKTGECPKGGDHEWTDENGETFCSKCKEPKAAKAKRGTKQATAEKPAKAMKPAKEKKPAAEKKMSAIDAAAKLLGDAGEPMNCKAIIEGIAAKGYWTSPGGKTPHATLYSAIIREISVKGKESRFTKTDRGNFAFNG